MLGRAIILSLCIFTLTSCAVKPKGPSYSEVTLAAKPNQALVVMYRTLAKPYSYDVDVVVDEQRVEILRDNTFVVFDVAVGKHVIKSDWSVFSGQHDSQIELEVTAGEIYYLAVDADTVMSGYSVIPGVTGYVEYDHISTTTLIDPVKAITEIKKCCVKYGISIIDPKSMKKVD